MAGGVEGCLGITDTCSATDRDFGDFRDFDRKKKKERLQEPTVELGIWGLSGL
jgi:hypothetical protein